MPDSRYVGWTNREHYITRNVEQYSKNTRHERLFTVAKKALQDALHTRRRPLTYIGAGESMGCSVFVGDH